MHQVADLFEESDNELLKSKQIIAVMCGLLVMKYLSSNSIEEVNLCSTI